jgi:FKBP12-rapamycin complex-associated protein
MHSESDVLQGRDFNPDVELSVNDQVEKLIVQATAVENLCQCFLGAIAT